MLRVTLPDNTTRDFSSSISILEIARSISNSLSKIAVAAKVNSRLVDLNYLLHDDSKIEIITTQDELGLEVLRHSCAHLMAMAVKELFPATKIAIGPVIKNGFYYDFSPENPFVLSDLEKIENKMRQLSKSDILIKPSVLSYQEAKDLFISKDEEYKLRILADLDPREEISCYQQGDFIDLCRGPHLTTTSKIQHFTLTKLAGAYWRGDVKNEMLQRIYGTCWFSDKDLQAHLLFLSEAEKRDHRKIGKKLDWFHMQEESLGAIFWHPKGWSIYITIENYLRNLLHDHGYQEIKTPQILHRSLWERSGHWDKFAEFMFTTNSENSNYAIKPMNCPGHVQVFNHGLKSYRDLPLRLSEFGSCHRNEFSGTLHGLMRVRAFTQDDAHIFTTDTDLQSEVSQFIDLVYRVYADFGFSEIKLNLSTRPDKRVGSDEVWDKAEAALQNALDKTKLPWQLLPKEGAFYGPKIEFSLQDCLGRVWQCGTIQVDFSMPARLNATYINAEGKKETPVMLHRAILGSFERFIGILIEHYAGNLPIWLAPVQIAIVAIAAKHHEYCKKLDTILRNNNLRSIIDLRNEKINFKIREHSINKVGCLLIVGDTEVSADSVTVRSQAGKNLGVYTIDNFINYINHAVSKKHAVLNLEE